MNELSKAHIVVIGGARSGVAAACLLKQTGHSVFLTDYSSIAPAHKKRLQEKGIPFEEQGHTNRAEKGDLAVVSPGVATSASIVRHYLDSGKKVWSEIETAFRFCRSPIVAVTGSNGKTTVTSWLDHTWQCAQKPHITAGNIGTAFSDSVLQTGPDKTVLLEVSSFQLDHIKAFRPKAAMILNITPDHLDRYNHSFEKYAAAKFNIFRNQTETDWLIYNHDDPVIRRRVEKLAESSHAPQLLPFSTKAKLEKGAMIENKQIVFVKSNHKEPLMHSNEVVLPGNHNLQNGMATALAARALEISSDAIRESLKSFEGVEHRLEFVRQLKGIRFINDSKATNINAVWYALESMNTPVVLILGGRDKGNDYTELHPLIYEKVHTVIAIGEAREKVKTQVGKVVSQLIPSDDFEEAIRAAYGAAVPGDTVLLSTACASFDMFENYEHRGNEFKRIVNQL